MWVLPLHAHDRGLHCVSISAWTGWDGACRAGAVERSGFFWTQKEKKTVNWGVWLMFASTATSLRRHIGVCEKESTFQHGHHCIDF